MSQHARVLVVMPDPVGILDRYEDLLTSAGVALRVVRPYAGEPLPEVLDDEGLVVLGGRMSANDDADHPWLEGIRGLLRSAHDRGRPALGICLGAQLAAQAFGGSVRRGDRGTESGVVEVRWRPEAGSDPLLAGLPDPFVTGAWHDDMVDRLPEGAVWAGRTDQYPHQAFRVGDCVWGVQFHPEVSAATYRGWLGPRDDGVPLPEPRAGLAREFERREAEVVAGTSLLARRFADLVRAAR